MIELHHGGEDMDAGFGTRLEDWNWEVTKEAIKDDWDILVAQLVTGQSPFWILGK